MAVMACHGSDASASAALSTSPSRFNSSADRNRSRERSGNFSTPRVGLTASLRTPQVTARESILLSSDRTRLARNGVANHRSQSRAPAARSGVSKTDDIGEELGQRAVWCSLLIELQSYRQRLPREATELRKRRPAGRVLFPMPCWVRASILRSASPACAGSGPWRRAGTPLTPPPTRASAVLSASGVA